MQWAARPLGQEGLPNFVRWNAKLNTLGRFLDVASFKTSAIPKKGAGSGMHFRWVIQCFHIFLAQVADVCARRGMNSQHISGRPR